MFKIHLFNTFHSSFVDFKNGKFKVVFASPEEALELESREVVTSKLWRRNSSLLVIDEAHCVSEG